MLVKPGNGFSLNRMQTSASYSIYRLEILKCDSPKSLETSDLFSTKRKWEK